MNMTEPIPTRYQAKVRLPFAVIGVRTRQGVLTGVDFLDPGTATLAPDDAFTEAVCEQLVAYARDPDAPLEAPLDLSGTAHRRRVWQALCRIPRGSIVTYGELARQIGSSARAVGAACGDNPLPLFVPCHRVVAKQGLGGFMHQGGGAALDIKQWLLRHEGWLA